MGCDKSKQTNTTGQIDNKVYLEDRGWFNYELTEKNLKLVEMPHCGNSFFMSIADQLEGRRTEHLKYRLKVRDHMMQHPE